MPACGASRLPIAIADGRRRVQHDLMTPYVDDLRHVIDMDAVRNARLSLAVDPLGGAAVAY